MCFLEKRIESDFLTRTLSQTPRASFEAQNTWLHYQTVIFHHPPRWGVREARSRVYSAQLTVSIWCYCFGGELIAKYTVRLDPVRPPLGVFRSIISWLLRLCMLYLCLSSRAPIYSCPRGTVLTYRVLFLCSFSSYIPFLLPPGFSTVNHQPNEDSCILSVAFGHFILFYTVKLNSGFIYYFGALEVFKEPLLHW